MMETAIALKEWAVIAQAMAAGEQVILLRKGGIQDPSGAFALEQREFLIYPTWEHQKLEWIREPFREKYRTILNAKEPAAQIPFSVYAGVAYHAEIKNPAVFKRLEKYHLWTPEFFAHQAEYRPQSPTLLVVVRAYQLKKSVEVSLEPDYAGCKSWVTLRKPVSIDGAEPVIENRKFRTILEEIRDILEKK